jgi:hypothetical protein
LHASAVILEEVEGDAGKAVAVDVIETVAERAYINAATRRRVLPGTTDDL